MWNWWSFGVGWVIGILSVFAWVIWATYRESKKKDMRG